MKASRVAGGLVGLALLAWATSEARAADVEIDSTTTAQAYEVANPWGNYQLERRRIDEMLGFSIYHLQGKFTPGKPDYTARVMFRLDADVGVNSHLDKAQAGGETSFDVDGGSRYVPGLSPARFDMMYAYVEGKNLAKGWLGFRAGRQYVADVLGFWSFDGALVRLTTPYYFEIEAYGGLEQRGGLPLSTSRYESQGVWRGTHSDFERSDPAHPSDVDYPSYQFAGAAPAFGFALESNGPNWLHGRLTYRRVYNTGDAFTRQFPDPNGGYPVVSGLRVSSDRLGYAANISDAKIGGIKGGFTYDFYNSLVPYAYAGIEGYLGRKVTLGADLDYYEPTFDADSIWNWFTKEPQMTPTARVSATITDELSLSASGGPKMFFTEGDPKTFYKGECAATAGACDVGTGFDVVTSNQGLTNAYVHDPDNRDTTILLDGIGQLAARYRLTTAKFEFRSMVQAGHSGRRVGGDVSAEKSLFGGFWSVGGRLSLYNFVDPIRKFEIDQRQIDRDATSFGYVLGTGFKPLDVSQIHVEWEHDINRLVGSRFRLLAMLDVAWIK